MSFQRELKNNRERIGLTRKEFANLARLTLKRYNEIEMLFVTATTEEQRAIQRVLDYDRNKALLKLAKWNAAVTPKPASQRDGEGGGE